MAKHCEVVIPEFSVRLREAIKRKNITQKELADRIGVTRHLISLYCCDYIYPTTGVLKAMCEELDCSADYLLELKGEME